MLVEYMCDSNRKHYSWATRSSPKVDQFHTKTDHGRFGFTWYRCKISYWSEILAPVQELGWTHARVTHAGMTFCGGLRGESPPGVM